MSLFFYRPTGRELQHQPVGMLELLAVAIIVIGGGVLVGLGCYKELGFTRDHSLAYGCLGAGIVLILWVAIRGALVRRGLVHPVGTMKDGRNHTCCSRQN